MIKFKTEYSSVISKIKQRNGEINNIKNLIKEYGNNKNQKHIGIEDDIKNSLKLIRLYTINLVSQIKKFFLINSYTTLPKINLKKIKTKSFNFDYKYLSKIKKDLNFLKDSSINNLYNFNNIENDPFLLTLSDKSQDDEISEKNESKYEILPITNEVYNQIIKLIFFMNQFEINEKIEKENKKVFLNNNNYINKEKNFSENLLTSNNELDIGLNYKGNINKIINKLKKKNNYENIFLNNISNINKKKRNFDKFKTLNIFLKKDRNIKMKEINDLKGTLLLTTAEDLQNKFKHYEKIKQFVEEESNKKNDT